MTVLTRNPETTDLLQPTKYLLTFDRIPTVQYFCQEANLPDISIGQAEYATPILNLNFPGTKITYSSFDISFIVDESLSGWNELYKWFRSIASPETTDERKELSELQKMYAQKNRKYKFQSDGHLTLLTNLNNINVRIQFFNMFPTSLSGISFDTKLSAEDVITCRASFTYDYFNIEPL
jgi:hypothetical protein